MSGEGIHKFDIQQSDYDLQLTINGHNSSIYKDLAMIYTNESWFVISWVVYITGTELPKYDTLVQKKPIIANNSEQE